MSNELSGLSYIVPLYNEESSIRGTLERLKTVLASCGRPFEIIAVNDGSSDASPHIAAEVEGVRVVSHPINCGYGAALKTGIRVARFPLIGIVDADGTYPIEELPRLLERIEQGFDMVVAHRQNVMELDRPVKRLFRKTFIRSLSLMINKKITDPNSGFRVFKRDMAVLFLPFLCDAFSFTTSITVFAFGGGKFISYVPIEYHKRVGKSKVRHFRDSIRTAQLVLQGVMFYNPTKFALIAGALFILFGAVPALMMKLAGISDGVWIYFWSVAIVMLLTMMGLLVDTLRITTIQSSRIKDLDLY